MKPFLYRLFLALEASQAMGLTVEQLIQRAIAKFLEERQT